MYTRHRFVTAIAAIMENKPVALILLLQLISASIGINPCIDYVLIYMANGLRSSDFDSRNSEISICDAYLEPATWYRFEHDAGNRLIERPVEPWYCATHAPIWMNGTHPTDSSETTASVCAVFSSEDICGWKDTIRIRRCNESGSEYFVYLLAVPPGCQVAYCVDAASRKQCIPPLVWLEDEFHCGVSGTPPTTSATTTMSSSERQSLTPTAGTSTQSSGWSSWGPWSVCSKPCDYGFQSRTRTCGQLSCEGPANDTQLCNEYNCQKLPEEKTRGIAVVFKCSDSNEDTMLTVVLNQPEIHNVLRKNINDICSHNVSMCCGSQLKSISPHSSTEFVQSEDIYPAQGSIEPRTDDSVYYQVIAIVNEAIDRTICQGKAQRRYLRQEESNPNFISFDVLLKAFVKSTDVIFQETGLIVIEYINPATVVEANGEEEAVSCPSLTCVLPITLCIAVLVLAAIIGGLCFAKRKLTSKTEPEPPSPEPPHYEEVLSADLRIPNKGFPYYVPLSNHVSHNEYTDLSDPHSLDFPENEFGGVF